ncbi:NAD(P)-binding domain-containing protein [Phycicoccus sp. SLBN-51]|uniref:NAD(P)-binding domain-containing protein n=1 Tax=Phycicoccus sp. SLBN-51 TaxID=2768447 RepID=UPI00114F060F|nr:NAD(P)-binding domain-containing protein [Phycicoccus sp. SLBN-51]TQJ49228.1 thioredoxin reductase [Phycicoccus sp. SLBN-51]
MAPSTAPTTTGPLGLIPEGGEGDRLPVVVIGAGPVGLAAAAHLAEHGLPARVLEAGDQVGAAMREWGHIRTFTPWQYIVDPAAERLLARDGWTRPTGRQSPTGAEIVDQYLEPLAAALGDVVRTGSRVVAVSRQGLDRSRSVGRSARPFVVRVARPDGSVDDLLARAVIDASGTWHQHNPLGASGLPALGEERARAAGFLVGPLPDVLGRDRARFAGRSTLVVGMGHSAANTLVALARLAQEEPGTRIVWAIRGTSARRVFGGGQADRLEDRGRLGSDLQGLVESGALEYLTGFSTRELRIDPGAGTVSVVGDTAQGERVVQGLHNVAAATGFRPDLGPLQELQLDLDPGLQSTRVLGPLITPEAHSCGTVAPHGWRELAHENEPGFFVVGMKSYGRAPTFLVTTGNEQVRSVVAHLAGEDAAADEVRLVLPETGVCSSANALTDEQVAAGVEVLGGCCDPAEAVETFRADPAAALQRVTSSPEPLASLKAVRLGFATGVPNGRAGDVEAEAASTAGCQTCAQR